MEPGQQFGFDFLTAFVHVRLEAFFHLDQVLLEFRIHTLSLLQSQTPNRP